MSYVSIGSQKTDRPTTPTLRQYLKQSGGVCPKATNVTVIFKPGNFGGWSLVCDGRFRVQILEDNPLHGILTDSIPTWSEEDSTLVVRVEDGSKPEWELSINTDSSSTWQEFDWGYKLTCDQPKPSKPDSRKSTRKGAE